MRDLLAPVLGWYRNGEAFALATVVSTFRSAPRQPGAAMAVAGDGTVVGSVSGGCVEGAVYEVAREVLAHGRSVVEHYGIGAEDAYAAGLTCGGALDVLVERVDAASFPDFGAVADAVAAGSPVAVVTRISGPGDLGRRRVVFPDRSVGSLGYPDLDAALDTEARRLLATGGSAIRERGGHRFFVHAFAPPPRMIVFGAIDFARAVCRIGAFLGYRITVCDARPVFATRERFPEADEVVVRWPHDYLAATETDERTVLCVLTHDPKFDIPLLRTALRMPVAYVGAMGSRATHEDRLARLRAEGLGAPELARLRSPIGLDLRGRTPEETAVSVAAEIIALRHGGSGLPLARTRGAIHDSPDT
ncbi:XdhC family protein [Yinghuangia aomiensis]|uniref:XdhC family protein n=1 Tax=Yinghuangia aomiensis TaxID=676205 RepID=A0ABP9I439_9ACTN